jgi:uncharacterized protein YndB with AHSA1/START domain
MNNNLIMNFSINKENHTIIVKREFSAELPLVRNAFTTSEILDQWWAPKPCKAKTKSMDFTEGGQWLHVMIGLNKEEHWSFSNYLSIKNEQEFIATDGFSDENGNINSEMPQSKWKVDFSGLEKSSLVEIEITFNDLAQLESTLDMGFKEGFAMGLENLDVYLVGHQN